ncbi:hypothetical protein HYDPIDRAFT_81754 [Hydnomerulius pinastri MD-312]|nr:hypothetical protein HYDPIDRAFT_81754 [Hydnomerulius pinastri MD-312]
MFDTVWPADSIEFCPHEGSHNIFVCGTYKLEQPESETTSAENAGDDVDDTGVEVPKAKQVRRGKCLVFEVSSEEPRSLSQIQEIDLPAILDQKWCHRSPSSTAVLGIADSEGNITLHEWEPENLKLELLQNISCASDDVLCLCLDWSNRRCPTTYAQMSYLERHCVNTRVSSDLGSLIVSLSNGNLSLLKPSSQGELTVTKNWHAHDYEPWIAAWNYWNPSVIYSGGDDLTMKGWDERQDFHQPTFVYKRFDAGVTTIQSHPHIEHLLAVGSYDNKVRLFDARNHRKVLLDVDVGGGAWRVKWHPSPERKHDLLVACMHDGFKVVRFGPSTASNPTESSLLTGDATYEIAKRFDEHTSLAYGVDWSFDQGGSGSETLIASCSFYDHALHLWSG